MQLPAGQDDVSMLLLELVSCSFLVVVACKLPWLAAAPSAFPAFALFFCLFLLLLALLLLPLLLPFLLPVLLQR